jgi:hypothetical protein
MKTVPTTVRNAAIDLALWLPEDTPSASSAGTDDVIEEITLGPIGIKMAAASSSGTTPTARPLIPSDIIMALRHFGSYVGGGVGVGRLVR